MAYTSQGPTAAQKPFDPFNMTSFFRFGTMFSEAQHASNAPATFTPNNNANTSTTSNAGKNNKPAPKNSGTQIILTRERVQTRESVSVAGSSEDF
jgi:hypothetical protein